MSDLFQGQSMSEAFKFISAGAANTFEFHFQPDKVTFYNLTQWSATAGNLPISVWFRDQTTAAHAYQEQVLKADEAAARFSFIDQSTNGFTVADTAGGVTSSHKLIDDIDATDPCVVTTTTDHGFQDNQIVRITDLGSDMPVHRGMDELNNNRYRITIVSDAEFSLKDVITGEPIDATGFVTYVEGGRVTLETHVLTLNNPQVSPYSSSDPYMPNPFVYDPITYQLTAGTAVMGATGNEFLIEVIKYGQVYDLGDFRV